MFDGRIFSVDAGEISMDLVSLAVGNSCSLRSWVRCTDGPECDVGGCEVTAKNEPMEKTHAP
jgi:hypothetical protein